MLRTAQKEFKFEAAHRLIGGYPGKCKNLHGHSYIVKVVVALRTDADLNEFGFVKDYADFKGIKEWIDENLDHSTIVSIHDEELKNHLSALKSKMYLLNETNTSAELICGLIFNLAKDYVEDDRVYVYKVTVNETCTSEATISF